MRRPKAHQRKNGTWEAKGYGPDGARKSFYASTREEAEQKASIGSLDQDTLYGYYADVFIPTMAHMAPATKRVYASAFDKWWIPLLGGRLLTEIKRVDVQRIVNRMPHSSGTVSQYVSKLQSVLDLAVGDGLIPGNPVRGVRRPKVQSQGTEPVKAWELKSLLESVDGGVFNAVVLMGFFGLRIEEACSVLKADFGDALEVRGTKSLSARRTLPVPEECEVRSVRGLFLVGASAQSVRWHLNQLGFQPHSLRKTFATVLEWELDCPRRVTRPLLGHAGSVTDVYSRPDFEALRGWLSRYWTHVSGSTTISCRTEGPGHRFA